MNVNVPEHSGKVSYDRLKQIERAEYTGQPLPLDSPRLLNFTEAGFRFDLLWSPKPNTKRLFVLFSGDALREKNDPPVFQRWSWAPHFPGHCLYISDPTLYLDPRLGLAWYAGTADFDPALIIRDRLVAIAKELGVPLSSVVTYGSSGGGFAALRMAVLMPEISVVCINPQTVIPHYKTSKVEIYLDACFSGISREEALEKYPERMSLLANIDKLRDCRIVYIQNTKDRHHYLDHYKPFCAAMGREFKPNEKTGNFRRLLFEHDGGHKKAETSEVFNKALEIIQEA